MVRNVTYLVFFLRQIVAKDIWIVICRLQQVLHEIADYISYEYCNTFEAYI